jgi:hypothetical protein
VGQHGVAAVEFEPLEVGGVEAASLDYLKDLISLGTKKATWHLTPPAAWADRMFEKVPSDL